MGIVGWGIIRLRRGGGCLREDGRGRGLGFLRGEWSGDVVIGGVWVVYIILGEGFGFYTLDASAPPLYCSLYRKY